jgi:hypothetical protein
VESEGEEEREGRGEGGRRESFQVCLGHIYRHPVLQQCILATLHSYTRTTAAPSRDTIQEQKKRINETFCAFAYARRHRHTQTRTHVNASTGVTSEGPPKSHCTARAGGKEGRKEGRNTANTSPTGRGGAGHVPSRVVACPEKRCDLGLSRSHGKIQLHYALT